MHCKNCKHFEYTGGDYQHKGVSGSCSCEKFRKGYYDSPIEKDEAAIEDDEGWGFVVGEEFGCIHFQQALFIKS